MKNETEIIKLVNKINNKLNKKEQAYVLGLVEGIKLSKTIKNTEGKV